jgi:hypothetical protein
MPGAALSGKLCMSRIAFLWEKFFYTMKKIFFTLALFGMVACTTDQSKAPIADTLNTEKLIVKTEKEIALDSIQMIVRKYVDDPSSYIPGTTSFIDTARNSTTNQPCGIFTNHYYRAKNKFGAVEKMEVYVLLDYPGFKIHRITKYFEYLEDFECGKFRKLKLPNLNKKK